MGRFDGVGTLLHLARGGEVSGPHETPHTIVADGPHRQVRRYGTDDEVGAAQALGLPPVLLVPPLAVSTTCYDLAPDISVVAHLLAMGRVPYVLDFGEMTRADEQLGFAGFFDDIVPTALAAVLHDYGADCVDLMAWSIGGTIGFLTLAANPDLPVRSMTAIGTPLNYHRVQPYPLVKAVMRPVGGKPITWALRAMKGIPAPLVRTAYRATAWQRDLRKPGYIMRNADDTDALTRMKAIDRFQETMPGYPGLVSVQMWENFILRDEIAAGVLHFGERTLDLSTITAPIQLFGSHRDAIVSWAAAHHGVDLFTGSSQVEFLTVETSHLGLIAGAAATAQTWPRVEKFLSSFD